MLPQCKRTAKILTRSTTTGRIVKSSQESRQRNHNQPSRERKASQLRIYSPQVLNNSLTNRLNSSKQLRTLMLMPFSQMCQIVSFHLTQVPTLLLTCLFIIQLRSVRTKAWQARTPTSSTTSTWTATGTNSKSDSS